MNQGGDTYLFDVIDAGGLVFEDSLEAWLSAERGPWRVSQNGKSPIAGWFRMEHPIKMDDNWGVPLFWETSMFGNKVALFCLFLPFSLWRPAAHEKNIDGLTTKWKKEVAYTVYIYSLCCTLNLPCISAFSLLPLWHKAVTCSLLRLPSCSLWKIHYWIFFPFGDG